MSECLVLGCYNDDNKVVLTRKHKSYKQWRTSTLTYFLGLFKIIKAPITPGTQAHNVSRKTIKKEPQPLSITAKGGKKIANKTLKKLISVLVFCNYLTIYPMELLHFICKKEGIHQQFIGSIPKSSKIGVVCKNKHLTLAQLLYLKWHRSL